MIFPPIILTISIGYADEKLFGLIGFDTIFTVSISIIVFSLGLLFQKWFANYKIRKRLFSIESHFTFLIKKLPSTYLDVKIKSLKDFYQSMNIDTGLPLLPPVVISGDLLRLKQISSIDIFDAFRIHYKTDNSLYLHQIISYVDYFIEQNILIDNYHKAILNQSDELRNEIQPLIEDYLNLVGDAIRDIKKSDGNYQKNPFWNYINSMMLNYYDKSRYKNTISYFYKTMLRPIQVELVQKKYDREIPIAEQITSLGHKITMRRHYLRNQTVNIRLQYRQFYQELALVNHDFQNACRLLFANIKTK